MPGNIVVINNSKELTWYIGDSKLRLLITFLESNSKRLSKEQDKNPKIQLKIKKTLEEYKKGE